jgi:isochorismate pyruvate lyase
MKNPQNCKNIDEIRDAIDGIDYQIMKLYSQRYEFVKAIVKFKTDEASVIAENRQMEVIEKRREWAVELGLNPDLFEEIFWTLIRYNVQKELEILKNANAKPV